MKKKNSDGMKRNRPVAAGSQDANDIPIRDKKKSKKNKKQKRIDAIPMDTNNGSKSLMASIFGGSNNSTAGSDDGTKNCANGGTTSQSSQSLINSIFDNNDNSAPSTTKESSAILSLFDNSKIPSSTRKNHHRQPFQPRQERPLEAKAASAAKDTTSSEADAAERIRRTLRNRKYRSEHRPLLKKALDFPGVFRNEETNDENAGGFGFLLNDENERAKETADAIRDHGFCILRNVMDTDSNDDNDKDHHPLRDVVLPAAKDLQRKLNTALKKRGINHTDTFRFREAASRCKGRTDVVFDTFEKSQAMIDAKQKVLRNSKIFPVIQNLLGGTNNDHDGGVKLVYAGLIFSYPGSCDQPWHQDGEPLFPDLPGDQSALLQASFPPYALNVFLPLEDGDGSIEKGPTEFLPGSHKWTAPDQRLKPIIERTIAEDEEEEESNTSDDSSGTSDDDSNDGKSIIAPVLKQGDALIYDYRVCHRGTANLFGRLQASKKHSKNTDSQTKHSRKKKKSKEKEERVESDDDSDFDGTRRILYLMYARPWFTDHVNFDYRKSAESLWDDHKHVGSNL